MHVGDRGMGKGGGGVEDVADAAVEAGGAVGRHVDKFDVAVRAEDFADVVFGDILCELLNHNLEGKDKSVLWSPGVEEGVIGGGKGAVPWSSGIQDCRCVTRYDCEFGCARGKQSGCEIESV